MSDLRYTIQQRDGLRWYTVRAHEPRDFDWGMFELLVNRAANTWKRPVRILLMPGNVLAFEAAPKATS